MLKIKLTDFFNLNTGDWNEKDYSERQELIKKTLDEIEKEFCCKTKIIKMKKG